MIKNNRAISLFDFDIDKAFQLADQMFSESTTMLDQSIKYPPTNIVAEGENVVLEMAVAGYTKENLNVSVDGKTLTITGTKKAEAENSNVKYIHKGISSKNFKCAYSITDREVTSVELVDGLLRITLKSIPPKSTKVEFEIK